MNKHVDHLLAAYVERQLRPDRAALVYQHVTECPSCRAKLTRHESMADELRMSLGQLPALRPDRAMHLWLTASSQTTIQTNRQNGVALLPLLLSLLLLLVPFTTGFSSIMPGASLAVTAFHAPGEAVAQALPDVPRAGANPLPDAQTSHLMLAATPAIAETPLPAAPAPLAPTSP